MQLHGKSIETGGNLHYTLCKPELLIDKQNPAMGNS